MVAAADDDVTDMRKLGAKPDTSAVVVAPPVDQAAEEEEARVAQQEEEALNALTQADGPGDAEAEVEDGDDWPSALFAVRPDVHDTGDGRPRKRRPPRPGLIERVIIWGVGRMRQVALKITVWRAVAMGVTLSILFSLLVTYEPHAVHAWRHGNGWLEKKLLASSSFRQLAQTVDDIANMKIVKILTFPITMGIMLALLPLKMMMKILADPPLLRCMTALLVGPCAVLYAMWLVADRVAWMKKQLLSVQCSVVMGMALSVMAAALVVMMRVWPAGVRWVLMGMDDWVVLALVTGASVVGTLYTAVNLESGLVGRGPRARGAPTRRLHVASVALTHLCGLVIVTVMRQTSACAFARIRATSASPILQWMAGEDAGGSVK